MAPPASPALPDTQPPAEARGWTQKYKDNTVSVLDLFNRLRIARHVQLIAKVLGDCGKIRNAFNCAQMIKYQKIHAHLTLPSPTPPSPTPPYTALHPALHPAQPSPAQPSPAQPSPAQPSPAQPSPAQPSPAQPSPAQPSPAQPSPAQPSPAQPSPAQPSPAQPSPAQPIMLIMLLLGDDV
ncbi:hypothetical protein V8C86DRAFT_3145051 [Haematococcus lacustris]